MVFCSLPLLIREHQRARCQAEIPLTAPSEIVEPLLTHFGIIIRFGNGPMTVKITRTEFSAEELRRKAGRVRDANQSRRLLALSSILDGARRDDNPLARLASYTNRRMR